MLIVRSIIGNTKVLVRLSFGVDSSKEVAMKLSVRSENESPIHCSCLVSFSQWLLLEGGCWVVYMECSKVNSFLARNFSNVKDVAEEMKKLRICRRSKGAIAPLFEILLTAGTTGNKSGSITVPNKYAEAYFPEVTDAQGIPLEFVYDDGVNEWFLSVCSDLDKTYVLDGLEEYMSSNNL